MARGELWVDGIHALDDVLTDAEPGEEGAVLVWAELWYTVELGRTERIVADYDRTDNPVFRDVDVESRQVVRSDSEIVPAALANDRDAIEAARERQIAEAKDVFRAMGGKIRSRRDVAAGYDRSGLMRSSLDASARWGGRPPEEEDGGSRMGENAALDESIVARLVRAMEHADAVGYDSEALGRAYDDMARRYGDIAAGRYWQAACDRYQAAHAEGSNR